MQDTNINQHSHEPGTLNPEWNTFLGGVGPHCFMSFDRLRIFFWVGKGTFGLGDGLLCSAPNTSIAILITERIPPQQTHHLKK